MDDSFLVHDHLTNKNPKSAVIVGAEVLQVCSRGEILGR